MDQITFVCDSEEQGSEALRALGDAFPTRAEKPDATRHTCYDTFDWRLQRDGAWFAVRKIGREFVASLFSRGARSPLRMRLGKRPAFAWDLPEGALRNALREKIEMRRLLPALEIEQRGPTLRILGADEKTVARAWLERRRAPSKRGRRGVSLALLVEPVRGYEKPSRKVVRHLRSLPLEESAASLVDALPGLSGRPTGYSSKLRVPIEEDLRADLAVRRVLRALFATLRANEKGLRGDVDSEFLHDFRVAVRRTRSALGRIKGVFPARTVERFRRGFAWLGAATGDLRDLDVYLLKLPQYAASLPPEVGSRLGPLRALLERRQRAAHRKLVRLLGTARYRDLLDAWEEFLDRPPPERTSLPNAARPIGEVARERTWRVFRRVLARGKGIGAKSPAEDLHRMRIEAKKLRYLMEFFRSLYEAKSIARLIGELKQLQDNLGDFNDLVVQQAALESFARGLEEAGDGPAETILALGRLTEALAKKEQEEREDFAGRFGRFSERKNTRLARRLFKPRSKP